MNVSPPRGSDPCRTIVECLFDYRSTAEERTQNRQYACADANALRYIIRKGIEPQKVLAPDEGESVTKWAKREAKYRRQKTASDTRSKVPEGKRAMKSEWADGELPVRRPSERRYRMLQIWAKKGVFLVEPKDNGRPLVVTVTELAGLTVDEGKRRPDKVRAAIENALDKLVKMAPAKRPTMPLMTRRVFDGRRSVSSGPVNLSKPVGEASLKNLRSRSHPYPRPAGNHYIRDFVRMNLTNRCHAALPCSDQRNGFPERQTLCKITESFLASATRALPLPDRLAIADAQSFVSIWPRPQA